MHPDAKQESVGWACTTDDGAVIGRILEQAGDTDLVRQVARAMVRHKTSSGQSAGGTSPVSHRKRCTAGLLAALEVVWQTVEGMEPPELPIDGEGWGAHRLAVLHMLGGGE